MSRVKMKDGSKTFVFYDGSLDIEEIRERAEEKSDEKAVKVELTFSWDGARSCYV